MNLFDRLFRRETPLETLKKLAQEHDSRAGDHDTLQGALADAVLCLKDEANRNGWLNGGEFHVECLDLIKRYLCEEPVRGGVTDCNSLIRDCEQIKDAALGGAFKGRFAYTEVDRLVEVVGRWCQEHPRPSYHDANQDFW